MGTLFSNSNGTLAAIAHNRIYERSITPVKDPTVELKLTTAQVELAPTVLRNQVLKYKVLLKQNQAPAPTIGEPTTSERLKDATEDKQVL